MLGPDISHRRTLVKSLVRNKYVREEVKKFADGNKSRKKGNSQKRHTSTQTKSALIQIIQS